VLARRGNLQRSDGRFGSCWVLVLDDRHRGDKFYLIANMWKPETGRLVVVKMHRLVMNAAKGPEVDHVKQTRLKKRVDVR
jgi:hypothetical protein